MIALVGSGGHAKVVLDALLMGGEALSSLSVRDGNAAKAGTTMMGLEIQHPELPDAAPETRIHLAFGDCARRLELIGLARAAGFSLESIVHPKAMISPTSVIGDGCFVAAGAIIAPDAQIGLSVIINHGAVVDHDCRVGDASHIAPNATLGGGVHVGQGVLVGSGATVLPGIKIADRAIIGAGAVVTRDVAEGETRIGLPRSASNGQLV